MSQEINKLIADFLGAVWREDYKQYEMFGFIESLEQEDVHFYNPEDMPFDTDWNWLMPVVDKIESILDKNGDFRYTVNIFQSSCTIDDHEVEGEEFIHMGGFQSKIDACHYAVVDFITWNNIKNNGKK